MNIILIGPPGSGKGTQAVKIAEKYKIPHIATGDLLREIAQNETLIGNKIKNIMAAGKLIPDKIVIDLIKEKINGKGFVLDGFPRTLNQAEMLDKTVNVDIVMFFDLSKEDSLKRLLGRAQKESREDDKKDVIAERLDVYEKQTKPLLDYYKGKLEKVNASKTVEEVFESVCSIIDSF